MSNTDWHANTVVYLVSQDTLYKDMYIIHVHVLYNIHVHVQYIHNNYIINYKYMYMHVLCTCNCTCYNCNHVTDLNLSIVLSSCSCREHGWTTSSVNIVTREFSAITLSLFLLLAFFTLKYALIAWICKRLSTSLQFFISNERSTNESLRLLVKINELSLDLAQYHLYNTETGLHTAFSSLHSTLHTVRSLETV